MPRVDFALHPFALAFAVFCTIAIGSIVAVMFHSVIEADEDARDRRSDEQSVPFIPEPEQTLLQDGASTSKTREHAESP